MTSRAYEKKTRQHKSSTFEWTTNEYRRMWWWTLKCMHKISRSLNIIVQCSLETPIKYSEYHFAFRCIANFNPWFPLKYLECFKLDWSLQKYLAIILNNLRIFLSASENFWKRKKISHSHLHTQSFVNVCHLYRNTNIVAKSPSPKLVENVFDLSSTIFVQVAFSSVVHSQLSLRSCHMKTWKYLSLKYPKEEEK